MTELVKQRCKSDCAPACFAMLTGCSIDDVIAAIGDYYDPAKGQRNDHGCMIRLGFHEHEFMALHKDWCIEPKFFKRFSWGRRAILCVPSLNIKDGFHAVYFDGRTLFDPSLEKTYSSWDDLQPVSMIILNEAC